MTIPSAANRSGPYACNGVARNFPYEFRIYDEAHVRVILTVPDGTESTLVLGTDYTVSGVGDGGGGAAEMAVAYAAGYQVTLILNVPFTQELDLENQGAYFAETIERALDEGVQRDLQLAEEVGRAFKLRASAGLVAAGVVFISDGEGGAVAGPTAAEIETAGTEAVSAAGTATGAADVATGAAMAAGSAAALADQFANSPPDTPVGGGYSARHWAAVARALSDAFDLDAYSTTEQIAAMLTSFVPVVRKLKVSAGLSLNGIAGSDEEPAVGDLTADRTLALNLAAKALKQELWNAGVDTTEAPISPAKLVAAIAALGGGGAVPQSVINFIASGNYTPSAGTKYILAVLIGGGGGAGGKIAGSSYPAGGYGGNGGLGLAFIKVKAGATYSFAVGAGGNGGSAGTNNGSAGGTTLITVDDITYSAAGGGGGAGSSSSQGASGADGGCSVSCLIGGTSAGQLSTVAGSSTYGDAGIGNPNNAGMFGTSGRITIMEFVS